MKHELKPCPFCGGAPELHSREGQKILGGAYIGCAGCGVSTPIQPTDAEVVQTWNHRAPLPTVPEGLDIDFPPLF